MPRYESHLTQKCFITSSANAYYIYQGIRIATGSHCDSSAEDCRTIFVPWNKKGNFEIKKRHANVVLNVYRNPELS